MAKSSEKITKYWKEVYSSKISNSKEFDVPEHFQKMASLMAPGKSFYWIANFHTMKLEMVSDSVRNFIGDGVEDPDLNSILSLAPEEEIENIHQKDRVILEFFLNYLDPAEVLDYKVSYTFKLKDHQGKEHVMLHQSTALSVSENGHFVHVFGINSDISHLTGQSSKDVSFINIKGGPSFYNVDTSKGKFEKSTLSKRKRLQEILSERELEIIREMALGYNSEEIGSKLNISGHTVNTHKKNILRKTDSRNSTQLVSNCLVEGLISI
ncbi:hypothetical protein GCM10023115_41800 [Pontixanthobacter gangjinensis]|uniref:Helix-turn-helix transcriptional regulator n=1 Tax=Christiangramia aestuarii TaxID=1028746 RepID=A0A7M3SYP8_9FLAO|nr:helix-turn-helix transcriptional regulator [Christiangramia aestuarii]MUP41729.1 helix-turn-helix transcriptional regulator [Christiangramia aestuarii]